MLVFVVGMFTSLTRRIFFYMCVGTHHLDVLSLSRSCLEEKKLLLKMAMVAASSRCSHHGSARMCVPDPCSPCCIAAGCSPGRLPNNEHNHMQTKVMELHPG